MGRSGRKGPTSGEKEGVVLVSGVWKEKAPPYTTKDRGRNGGGKVRGVWGKRALCAECCEVPLRPPSPYDKKRVLAYDAKSRRSLLNYFSYH